MATPFSCKHMRGVKNDMGKYLVKRILRGILSIIAVVAIVMMLVYALVDRDRIFAADGQFTKTANNDRVTYMYQRWEEYGYLDYVTYNDYLNQLVQDGELDEETRSLAGGIGRTPDKDDPLVAEYVAKFTEHYESQGYEVIRLEAKQESRRNPKLANGGQQQLFASKDVPLLNRMLDYFTSILHFDNINRVKEDVGERGLTFTWYDPVYGGEKFSPAIIGNGTEHKYLFYMNDQFPYFHQNMLTIQLGTSYSITRGLDVFHTLTRSQGTYVLSDVTYPTGHVESSADDLHTATYRAGSRTAVATNETRFIDDYTDVATHRRAPSKIGFSFINGIISTCMAYCIGLPVGVAMARKKDKLIDKIGTVYIIFIIAVPALAYIFLFKSIGGRLGLPTTFDMESGGKLMFVLPIISLALPSIAGLMKWLRRYMIDQMNSDYVKFARSGGLTENEIFTKHILKNAVIPIVHGVPGSLLFAMTGAIITERVYVVPGAGNVLTEAINKYDNGVIVGVALFYAILSVTSIILGDILMATVDPRISFSTKDR